MSANTTTTDRRPTYPVGLTVREIEQRAWIEGDLQTAALLASRDKSPSHDDEVFALGVRGQLPLEVR